MFERELVSDIINQVIDAAQIVQERCQFASSQDDFISHHYFDLDAEVIFGICQNNIGDLLVVLKQIQSELQ